MTGPDLWQAQFALPRPEAHTAADWLSEAHPDVLSVSLFEEIGGRYALTVLFSGKPDRDVLDALLGDALGSVPGYALDAVPDEDWIARGLADLKPVRAGRFYVHGSHDAPAPGGTHSLLIEAGEAFGTGQHPTTRGCLLALDRLLKRGIGGPVFDLGCGTGVLSIAFAKATRMPVLAGDIDPASVRFARAAARANAAAPLVRAVAATGFANPAIQAAAPFELVLANVLAGPLIALAPAMRTHTAPGAAVVLSGLLRHQSRAVEAAYRNQGFRLIRRIPLGEWMTLVLGR